MFYDKDSRGTMSITDITREDAMTLRDAARMLLRKMERKDLPDEKTIPTGPWYRAEVGRLASTERLRDFIRAVNTFFPNVMDATVGGITDS